MPTTTVPAIDTQRLPKQADVATTRILVVEDERIVAFNLQQRLQKLGYEVPALAVNAEQTLRAIEKYKPNIILMDIHIEGPMDGIETARLVTEKYRIPIIFLTAYSEETTLSRAKATRPYGYLLKPFSERELHATIQMALERHSVELALNLSEARLRLALSAADMGDWEIRKAKTQQETLYIGEANHILGYPEQVFSGTREDFIALVEAADREHVSQGIDTSITGNCAFDIEFRTTQTGGNQRWLRLQGKMMDTPSHEPQLVGIIQNISERKATEHFLKQAATVFEATQDGILLLNKESLIVNCNNGFTAMTGYVLDDVRDQTPEIFTHLSTPPETQHSIDATLRKGGKWRSEVSILKKDGTVFPALLSIASVNGISHGRDVSHFVLILTDLTPIRSAEKKLQYLAHYDPLTNIPNRLLTMERLTQALLRGKRHNERIGVLFIDLDRFKWVNDTLGHDIGDQLLQAVTQRMQSCLRADDTIGRLGGDEFLAILDPVENEQSAAIVASKLANAVSMPVTLGLHSIEISCSIGVSFFPDDGQQSDILVRAADTAMYAAKERGRNCYEFFTPLMLAKAMRFMALNHDLHRGLKAGELRLHYQPQVALTTGNIVGLEALIRWQHPEKGLLGAAEIIPVAEDSGLIVDIGEWVLREVCNQVNKWTSLGIPPIPVAVNVSAFHIKKLQFCNRIESILHETGVNADSLEIEITESVLQSEGACISTLDYLRRMGVIITIDDFGTGYSCLSSLKLLPINKLKIDKAFIQGIPDDKNDIAITEAIIAMAQKLGMQVIAEGVETKDQLDFLRSRCCDEVQGYYYFKPMPAEQIQALMQQQLQHQPHEMH